MAFGGTFLKLLQTVLYALEFCCAGIIIGIYSYFMSVLADRDVPISKTTQAVEGMSGLAVLYTLLAVLLTCCLGGKKIFALLAIILDILFCGAFVAIAVLVRDGARKCTGNVRTPIGNGPANSKQGFGSNDDGNGPSQVTYSVSLGAACRLNTAVFAVAIVGAFLFLISAIVQYALMRHHRKEKRFGPSPANNYTRGTGVRFWQRKPKHRDAEMAGAVPATGGMTTGHTHDMRPSHDTAYTGSTVANNGTYDHKKTLSGGYHTAPTATHNNGGTYNNGGAYNNTATYPNTAATNY